MIYHISDTLSFSDKSFFHCSSVITIPLQSASLVPHWIDEMTANLLFSSARPRLWNREAAFCLLLIILEEAERSVPLLIGSLWERRQIWKNSQNPTVDWIALHQSPGWGGGNGLSVIYLLTQKPNPHNKQLALTGVGWAECVCVCVCVSKFLCG